MKASAPPYIAASTSGVLARQRYATNRRSHVAIMHGNLSKEKRPAINPREPFLGV
jgi:hypothetical protein